MPGEGPEACNRPMSQGGGDLLLPPHPGPHSQGLELPGQQEASVSEKAPERGPGCSTTGTCRMLGPFQTSGVPGGRKRTTQPQHVTSGRRSQVGRRRSLTGCGSGAPRPPGGETGRPGQAQGVGARGPAARSRASAGFGLARVGSRCPAAGGRAGGRAVSCPARRLPPRPPASCGGCGRHVVVGLRRRRGARAAVTGCATGSLSAAGDEPGGGVRAGSPASARARAAGAEAAGSQRDVQEARRRRQVGEAAARLRQGAGRCGRRRCRRGRLRGAGTGSAARAGNADRGDRFSGAGAAPRARPLAGLAAPGGNLRPRVPALRFLPPPRGPGTPRGRGPADPPRRRPGRGLSRQVRTRPRAGGDLPLAFGVLAGEIPSGPRTLPRGPLPFSRSWCPFPVKLGAEPGEPHPGASQQPEPREAGQPLDARRHRSHQTKVGRRYSLT